MLNKEKETTILVLMCLTSSILNSLHKLFLCVDPKYFAFPFSSDTPCEKRERGEGVEGNKSELDKIRFIMFIKSFLESLFSYSLSAEFSATLEVWAKNRRRKWWEQKHGKI